MNVLVCSTAMPEYDRDTGSRRVFDHIQMLRESGWQVTYVARDARPNERYARMLQQSGVAAHAGFDTLSDEFLDAGHFDVALLEYWHVAEDCLPRLRARSPGTRILVDSIDIHFLRNSRAAFCGTVGSTLPRLDSSTGDEFVREVNVYAAADSVLAVSEKEASLIADLISGSSIVQWVPLCEYDPPASRAFQDRRGVLFVGNFWHKPNVDAAIYLANEILPLVSGAVVADHPLWIMGNASDAKVGALTKNPHVRVVGWVPSLTPYYSQVRVSAVPLRYGGGVKGKLVQSLAAGTPVVSTSIGAEGLALTGGEDLLIADTPRDFAAALEELLTNEERWHRFAARGPQRVATVHGRDAVKTLFLSAIHEALEGAPKSGLDTRLRTYDQIRRRAIEAIERTTPMGARISVVSRGDERLVTLDGRRGEHFPRLQDGRYAGSYPADGAEALEALRSARRRGVDFFVLPAPAAWWLEYYTPLAGYLAKRAKVVFQDESCAIYALTRSATREAAPQPVNPVPPPVRRRPNRARLAYDIERHRPRLDARVRDSAIIGSPRVLVLGIYVPMQVNNAADEVAILRRTERCLVDQHWVALGDGPIPALADVTVAATGEKTPKFAILNRLITSVDIQRYDYLVLMDDDIVIPDGFLDAFIGAQQRLQFALAQPARTSDSYLDHPIVEQQRGVLARQTLFVEIGPVTSIHRSLYDVLLPFDLTSSMGWGYENVWAHQVRDRGLKMGIVDAVPVSHSMRKPAAHYSWDLADAERHAFLAAHPHLELDECFRVLQVVGLDGVAYA